MAIFTSWSHVEQGQSEANVKVFILSPLSNKELVGGPLTHLCLREKSVYRLLGSFFSFFFFSFHFVASPDIAGE